MNKLGNSCTISREVIFKLLSNMGDVISTADLGWWLEIKTDTQFTVVQVEFIREVLKHLDLINTQNIEFRDKWLKILEFVKRDML